MHLSVYKSFHIAIRLYLPDSHICPMEQSKRFQKDQEDYEAMIHELNLIRKAMHMVWRREQRRIVDEWLMKEDLK
jgi:hypothetical protein